MVKKKTNRKRKDPGRPQDVPFEQSLEQLQRIVEELEGGNLTLTESLAKYQAGIESLKQCHVSLATAKKQIELLVHLDDDGNAATQAFDDSTSLESASGGRRETRLSADRSTVADDAASEIANYEPSEDLDDFADDDDDDDERVLF